MARASAWLGADSALTAAARSWPDRTAIICPPGRLTYRDLDCQASSCAAALRGIAGPGGVVAVFSVLHPDFAVGYYAAIRAGLTVTPLNPFARPEVISRNLAACQASVALVSATAADQVSGLRGVLPALREVIGIGAPDPAGPDLPGLTELAGGASAGRQADPEPAPVACILFTSGTTGEPKAVPLTHRNLAANAVQAMVAHQLGPDSITLNHLPTYHPMHLAPAVQAGAMQVLCVDPDPLAAAAMAAEHGATHFYSLPVRLGQLARDPRLAQARMPAARVILSGGSALPLGTAATLSQHLGIPVVQGYGLAEASPLTHSGGPVASRLGSVGRPVIGTECQITDPATGAVLGCGQAGEIQVRGPQVMSGYLAGDGPSGPPVVSPDGWLPTGDVGRVDADGYLFLIDRLKDTFKCGNWLVSPSEVERWLSAAAAIAECAVLGQPDDLHGEVAAAFIVADGPADPAVVAAAVVAANSRAPEHERIRRATLVSSLPRSPAGKIDRRLLSRDLAAGAGIPVPLDLPPADPAAEPRPT